MNTQVMDCFKQSEREEKTKRDNAYLDEANPPEMKKNHIQFDTGHQYLAYPCFTTTLNDSLYPIVDERSIFTKINNYHFHGLPQVFCTINIMLSKSF